MVTRLCVTVALLASACGGNPAPVSQPDFDRVIVPWAVPGDVLFCVEEPFLTRCPMTVDQLRAWIAALRRADD